MDPDATYAALVDARAEHFRTGADTYEEQETAAANLAGWLHRGGYWPSAADHATVASLLARYGYRLTVPNVTPAMIAADEADAAGPTVTTSADGAMTARLAGRTVTVTYRDRPDVLTLTFATDTAASAAWLTLATR